MDQAVPGRSVRPWRLAALAASLVLLAIAVAGPQHSAPGHARVTAVARPGAARTGAQVLVLPQLASASRIPAAQLRALLFLCHRGPTSSGSFDLGVGENVFGAVTEKRLTPVEQREFDQQWSEAVAAALRLRTPEQASGAGYVQAAPFNAGVGAHWINWSLVARPFNPAVPSMLLFDGLPGRPVRLVGFAYWVESDKEPAGFAGPNDRWHRHSGLCFSRDGWLAEQNVHSRAACDGYWLSGRNLWMLHAWVVPDFPNRWGRLAPTNPALCPGSTKEILSCQTS